MNFKLLLTNLLLFFTPILSVIQKVEVWSNGTHYRYLLGDWHCDYLDGRISIKQHKDILKAAQQPNANDVFVLAEDIDNYSGKNKKIQDIYNKSCPSTIEQAVERSQRYGDITPKKAAGSAEIFLKEPMTPLHCLIAACQTQGTLHYNTECAYACGVYPGKVTKQEFVDDLAEHVAGLKQHDLLKKNYEQHTQELEALNTMNLPDIQPAFNKQYLRHVVIRKFLGLPLPTPAEREYIEKAEKIRTTLVNDTTVQKLIEWDSIKHGFVCEGDWHIESLKPYLRSLGYQHIQSFGHTIAWPSPKDSEEQCVEKVKQAVQNALDLQATFKQIFAQTAG